MQHKFLARQKFKHASHHFESKRALNVLKLKLKWNRCWNWSWIV